MLYSYFDNGVGYRYVETGDIIAPGEKIFDHIATEDELKIVFPNYICHIQSIQPTRLEINMENLWLAATNYESSEISGSAPAMVAIGIIKDLPKCKAVSTWITSIWILYYSRKSLVTNDILDPAALDFSSCGKMPYTVPELMAEVLS